MPTQAQLDQATQIAADVLATELNKTVADVLANHKDELFHMVCAFAATAGA